MPSPANAVILIGPITEDPTESVSSVNKSFIAGLGSQYHFVGQRNDRGHGTTRLSQLNLLNGIYFLRQCCSWAFNLARHRPAIAHYAVNSGWAMEKSLFFLGMARRFGIKTIGHLHSGSFLTFWESLSPARRQRAYRGLSRLDRLIVLSESWRKSVHEQISLPLDMLRIVNNPIDAEFERTSLQVERPQVTDTVLSLGTMGRDKGLLDILEAARLLDGRIPGRILLAGPEREPGIRDVARNFIVSHSLSRWVELREGVWGSAKMDLFRESAIFLLPSYFENFPLVVIEAAAAGQAIITTPVGAIPEFFTDNVSALFIQPGKPQQIANALLRLGGKNNAERLRLGMAARHVFQDRLRRSHILSSLNNTYQELLASSAHRASI